MSENAFAARRARGKQSERTRRSRKYTISGFAKHIWASSFQINTAGQIKERHIFSWVEDMRVRGLSTRTICNNVAHVRACLEGVGRKSFVQKRLTYKRLGISGAPRDGSKSPMPDFEFREFLAAAQLIDPGVAMCLELEYVFGLRAQEAVMCGEWLKNWLTLLTNPLTDDFIWITKGTKGGRSRRSPPVDRLVAQDVVRRALAMWKEFGGVLIRKPDLKSAMARYQYVVHELGMIGIRAPHALRYAYVARHLEKMAALGFSWKEAGAATSTYLGHADTRGRWVLRIYGREIIKKLWPDVKFRRRKVIPEIRTVHQAE